MHVSFELASRKSIAHFEADTSEAFFAVNNEMEPFQLPQWYRYSKTRSWRSVLGGSYHFGIADEIHDKIHGRKYGGAIGLSLCPYVFAVLLERMLTFHSRRQQGFINAKNAPRGGIPVCRLTYTLTTFHVYSHAV